MANIPFANNLWVTYYEDDTEPEGFYIDNVYIGTDTRRENIYDWLSASAIDVISRKIEDDILNRKAWRESA